MDDFKQILKNYALETDRVLEELFEDRGLYLSATLIESIKYSLFSGGKRIRPILCRMTAEMFDGDIDSALKAGSALEMIHTYSLIHDDLPDMDNDQYRRGRLTNHCVYGNGIAILAGDGLLTYAFNVLSKLSLPAEKSLKIIELISESAGVHGMVAGQVLDLEAENRELTLQELEQIHRAKTGALFRAAVLSGAYCSEISSEDLKALESFSLYLGLTFQIVDDILDLVGDEEKMGKKVGSDEKLNKFTYPRLLGLDKARQEAENAALKAVQSLEIFGERANLLRKLVYYILQRQF
jgi:geranylgeranyl diphosphate synthase type II